jgi:hypothetical protein
MPDSPFVSNCTNGITLHPSDGVQQEIVVPVK